VNSQQAQSAAAAAEPVTTGRSWDALWLIAIVLLAFVLRLIYVLQLQASPYFSTHVMDPQYHHEWARAFAAGERFWDGPYFRAPLYPWSLGVVYWLFGADNALAPRIVQAVLGALSCGLLFLIGRQVFSRTVGVIAGLAAATYWIFLYYDAELLIPVLIVFLDLALLWLLLWTRDRRSPLLWAACGLILGLSAIARPNILLFAPVLVIWVLVLQRPHWRRGAGYAACLFAGCMLPIVPITIRNYVVGNELVLIASQGGVNFYIGNNPHADGMSAVIKGDPVEWRPCYEAQIARAERAVGRRLTASEVSRWYFRQALRFMRQQPGQATMLLLKKLACFWSHWETSNNQDIRFITSNYAPITRYLPVTFWIVGPLGALGLVLSLRRAKQLFPLWGFVLIYMLSVVLFFVTARYRVPVAAVLILLGSHAVCWLVAAARARRWRALAPAVLLLAGMGAIAARVPRGVDTQMVQGYRSAGLLLAERGDFVEAERLLSESVRRAEATGWPIHARTWYYLGYARLKQEKLAEARECFENALRVDPDYPDARNNLAVVLAALGQLNEAVEQFDLIVQRDPDNSIAHANLANALWQLRRIDEAITRMQQALEIARANGSTAEAARYEQALRRYEAARRAPASSPGTP
jgi:tetratricopeptide (TPR) repeat protein